MDSFQITTTALMVLLGGAILVQAGRRHAPLDAFGIGVIFLVYGLYRARFIWRFWRNRRTVS